MSKMKSWNDEPAIQQKEYSQENEGGNEHGTDISSQGGLGLQSYPAIQQN